MAGIESQYWQKQDSQSRKQGCVMKTAHSKPIKIKLKKTHGP